MKKIFCKLIILAITLVFTTDNIFAKPTKTYDGIILAVPLTAQNAGAASANAAFVSGINSLTSNPAGLATANHQSILFSHIAHFQNTNFQYLATLLPINYTNVNIGFDIAYFSSGNIEKTQIDNNANFIRIGSYKNYEYLIGAGYAINPLKNLNVGGTIKFLQSNLADVSANAVRCSLGTQKFFDIDELTKLAISFDIRNFGSELKYDNEKNKSKEFYRIGAGLMIGNLSNYLKSELNIEYVESDKLNYYIGLDAGISKILNLRSGYESRNDAGNKFSFGLGFNLVSSTFEKGINFDYAYTPYGELGKSHKFSVSFEFGQQRDFSKIHTQLKKTEQPKTLNYQLPQQQNIQTAPQYTIPQNIQQQPQTQQYKQPQAQQKNNIQQQVSPQQQKINAIQQNQSIDQLFNKILFAILSNDLQTAQQLLNNDFKNNRVLLPDKFIFLNKMLQEKLKK
ncbi:MAG TPA: PorV/PorQ family protein [bacterium]|nr:PorV/PorQ family protein [bacterium]